MKCISFDCVSQIFDLLESIKYYFEIHKNSVHG